MKKEFHKIIKGYYAKNQRKLPWRKTRDPYKILVSEVMLQQTQVVRVIPKYKEWIARFPTLTSLSTAPRRKVLEAWQGLGYNRRAVALHELAKIVVKDFAGKIPREKTDLLSLPGIGPYTAGAIRVFVWNEPGVLIETNIRTVFIHHFFRNQNNVSDKEILPYIEKTLDVDNPREWYWALMDYGAHLKSTLPNPSRQSQHYRAQSPFKGSNREERAKIIRFVLQHGPVTAQEIFTAVKSKNWEITQKNISQLTKEGLIEQRNNSFFVR